MTSSLARQQTARRHHRSSLSHNRCLHTSWWLPIHHQRCSCRNNRAAATIWAQYRHYHRHHHHEAHTCLSRRHPRSSNSSIRSRQRRRQRQQQPLLCQQLPRRLLEASINRHRSQPHRLSAPRLHRPHRHRVAQVDHRRHRHPPLMSLSRTNAVTASLR